MKRLLLAAGLMGFSGCTEPQLNLGPSGGDSAAGAAGTTTQVENPSTGAVPAAAASSTGAASANPEASPSSATPAPSSPTSSSANSPSGATTPVGPGNSSGIPSCPATGSTTTSGDLKIVADASSNYQFTSALSLTITTVAEKTILDLDWSAVTRDMYGRAMDPRLDIGGVLVTMWSHSIDELAAKINNDELVTQDRKGAGYYFTKGQVDRIRTDELTSDGESPLTEDTREVYFSASEFPPDQTTYLVMLQRSGREPGKDGRMLGAFRLSTDPNAPRTVLLNNSSTSLRFSADMSQLKPIAMPIGLNRAVIDWSNLTTNAMGRAVDPYELTRVVLASFDLPVSELQKNENFRDLETLAVNLWESNPDDITSTKLSLTKLTDKYGNLFGGIDSSHTWILALECMTCLNPAPWYLTVLQPCAK